MTAHSLPDGRDVMLHLSKNSAFIAAALVAAGCSKSAPSPDVESAKVPAELKKWAADASKGLAATRAKEEALARDRGAIVRKAIDAMRNAAAENFGSDAAKAARIEADESGIKDFGDRKWEVAGRYVGADDKGKRFRASWTATIFLGFGNLQCQSVKLGDRQPEG
jgi:hypothetical protein